MRTVQGPLKTLPLSLPLPGLGIAPRGLDNRTWANTSFPFPLYFTCCFFWVLNSATGFDALPVSRN
jgi:hypothetical protein